MPTIILPYKNNSQQKILATVGHYATDHLLYIVACAANTRCDGCDLDQLDALQILDNDKTV